MGLGNVWGGNFTEVNWFQVRYTLFILEKDSKNFHLRSNFSLLEIRNTMMWLVFKENLLVLNKLKQ